MIKYYSLIAFSFVFGGFFFACAFAISGSLLLGILVGVFMSVFAYLCNYKAVSTAVEEPDMSQTGCIFDS